LRIALPGLALSVALSTAGCTSPSDSGREPGRFSLLGSFASGLTSGRPEAAGTGPVTGPLSSQPRGFTDLGEATSRSSEPTGGAAVEIAENGTKVTLNFANAEIQDFVRVVFDEVLKESVIIDPSLTGQATIRTTEPVTRKAALSLVRNVLQLHGATLTKSDGVFRVAARGSGSGQSGAGGDIRVVPLRHIGAEQARAALQPLVASGTQVVSNSEGRFLVVSGQAGDIDAVIGLLDSLDIDQMRGQSFALVPLKDAGASAVATELTQMFGAASDGGFKALPIQRMNAVLLLTRSADTLDRAKTWIAQLDQTGGENRQMRVFPIQNRRAADLAKILNGMLVDDSGDGGPQQDNPPAGSVAMAGGAKLENAALTSSTAPALGPAEKSVLQGVQVRADSGTNSLVVMARPEAYAIVEAAIRRLDILPTQVLIEATIAEVGLNDALRYGVRWYFQQGNHGVSLGDSAPLPGFNYVFNVPQGKIVVNALEKVTDVEVISSPALTVLDNETANLKVGDQVPVATRSARSVTNPDAPVVNDIELRDTGIILTVTPRVNASGLVMLDISQEVSDVVPTATSGIDSPTIRQRKINSSVAVPSGAEIVLGGLISTSKQAGKDGVPILKDIPLLGAAFTSDAVRDKRRTELLVIIRPTVIANRIDLQRVTDEIKAGMSGLRSARGR
jgi:general secretion pathway protein D